MAIAGAEKAVSALLSTLQSYTPAEIALINAERNDANTLPYVEAFEPGRPGKMFGDETQINGWCESSSFGQWDSNASGWNSSLTNTVNGRHECIVLLRHANRSALTGYQMEAKSQRYAAAILRVLLAVQDLGLTGVGYVQVTGIQYGASEDGETKRLIHSVALSVVVDLSEDSINSGVAGGGNIPTLTIQIRA